MAGPLKLVRKNQGKALIKLGMETGNVSKREQPNQLMNYCCLLLTIGFINFTKYFQWEIKDFGVFIYINVMIYIWLIQFTSKVSTYIFI